MIPKDRVREVFEGLSQPERVSLMVAGYDLLSPEEKRVFNTEQSLITPTWTEDLSDGEMNGEG